MSQVNKIIKFFKYHNEIKELNYVFLDIFDTTIYRKCHPEHIKKLWASKACLTFEMYIKPSELYRIRLESEIYLTEEKQFDFDGEYNYLELCKEVYDRLNNANLLRKNCTVDFNSFYKRCLSIEIEVEESMQYLNKEILDAINYIKNKNVKIICISDFYLPKKVVKKFILRLGISEDIFDIFVSCDLRISKRSGTIYSKVLEELGVSPSNVIMIGANIHSDFKMEKINGISALYIKNNSEFKKYNERNLTKHIWKLAKKTRKEKLPYVDYIFSLFLYISKLYYQLKKDNIQDIFFLSREGEYLKKLFETYQSICGDIIKPIKAHYFYASRMATFVPSLESLENENFERLFREYNEISLSNFLKSIGFNEMEINTLELEIDLDFYDIINDFPNSKHFLYLKNSKNFIKMYEDKRITQRENLHKYISSFRYDIKTKGLALADVGWKGTMQDNILASFNDQVIVKGYYIGIRGLRQNKNKKGLLFDAFPYKSKNFDLWQCDYTFFERILTASHGSTIRYDLDIDKSVKPVFVTSKEDKKAYENILPMQNIMMCYFKEICSLFKVHAIMPEEIYDEFKKIHFRACVLINKKHMNFQHELLKTHYENFGIFIYSNNADKNIFVKKLKLIMKMLKRQGMKVSYQNLITASKKLATLNLGALNTIIHFLISKTIIRKVLKDE